MDSKISSADRYWTFEKISTAFVVSFGKMVQLLCCLGLAPFYPEEAVERGNTSIEIGILFGVYPLVGFLCSSFVGKMLSKGYAPKKILLCGLLIDSAFIILFSMLYRIHDSTWFFIGSVFCRGFQSVGVTMSSVTYYGIAAANFPDKMTVFIPIIETMSGLGVMVGPTIGGILHEIGGFPTPFLTFAGMTITFMVIAAISMPPVKMTDDSVRDSSNVEGGSDSGSIKAIISDWRMLIDVVTVFTGFVAVSFNDATLAILLDRFGLNSASKGATFLISACCYSVASLIYGRIGKIIRDIRITAIFGGVCLMISWAFTSALPLFPFRSQLWLVLLMQAILGIGAGAFYISSYSHGHTYLTTIKGFPNDYRTYSIMAGVIQSAFFLGSLSGATGGGILLQYLGYERTTLVIVALMGLLTLVVTATVVSDHLSPPIAETQQEVQISMSESVKFENDFNANESDIRQI
ncbi:MFS-type transporter SLC18B1-like isoform X1 [Varroa jacobsoni]|uniref:MFS-type transporter SLC18B1-like isoform X1 n=1 Tax=Varroa jacobsoni TaxID=62625 RepID=UPI000BF65522|nr:MFS-type transporter SLC18B1-like isoform X1 [Varroa jacobsoni]